jgi:hypothetical protein
MVVSAWPVFRDESGIYINGIVLISLPRHDASGAGHRDGGGVSAGALQSGRLPQNLGHAQGE